MILATHGIIASGKIPSTLNNNIFSVYNAENNTNDYLGLKNGTPNGGLTYSTGKIGQSFNLNGTNSFVSLPDDSHNFTGDFTVSLWFNFNNNIPVSNLFSNFKESSGNYYGFRVAKDTTPLSNRFYFYIYNGTSTPSIIYYDSSYSQNIWYHFTLIRKSSISNNIYINGVNQALVRVVGNDSINPSYLTGQKINIGSIDTYGQYFDGKIDAFSTWNRALTSAEVLDLYNSGNGKQYPY
jgi:hypothetical protein